MKKIISLTICSIMALANAPAYSASPILVCENTAQTSAGSAKPASSMENMFNRYSKKAQTAAPAAQANDAKVQQGNPVDQLIGSLFSAHNVSAQAIAFDEGNSTLKIQNITIPMQNVPNAGAGNLLVETVSATLSQDLVAALKEPEKFQGSADMVDALKDVSVTNVRYDHTSKAEGQEQESGVRASVAALSLKSSRIAADVLKKLLTAPKDVDVVALWQGVEFDEARATGWHNETGSTDGKTTLDCAEFDLKAFKRGTLGEANSRDWTITEGDTMMKIASVQIREINFPMQELMAQAEKGGQEDDVDLLASLFGSAKPFVASFEIGNIILGKAGNEAKIASVKYLAKENLDKKLLVNGVVVPTALLAGLFDTAGVLNGLSELHMDAEVALAFAANTANNIKLALSELGEIQFSFEYASDMAPKVAEFCTQPTGLLRVELKKVHLGYKDNSLLARLLTLSPDLAVPEKVNANVEAMWPMLQEELGNDQEMLGAIRTFLDKPGKIEANSPDDSPLVLMDLLLDKAARAKFKISATAGDKTLAEQLGEILKAK